MMAQAVVCLPEEKRQEIAATVQRKTRMANELLEGALGLLAELERISALAGIPAQLPPGVERLPAFQAARDSL
jgi:hypothetical protein